MKRKTVGTGKGLSGAVKGTIFLHVVLGARENEGGGGAVHACLDPNCSSEKKGRKGRDISPA